MLKANIESYVKRCNVCLASKLIKHKIYGDLQSLPFLTHQWKNLSIDFITKLPVSTNWKNETYDSILVIIDRLAKRVYNKPIRITSNALGLVEIIIKAVVRHHGLPNSIVGDCSSVFTLKFWILLCYFFEIKQKLLINFYVQIDSRTKR